MVAQMSQIKLIEDPQVCKSLLLDESFEADFQSLPFRDSLDSEDNGVLYCCVKLENKSTPGDEKAGGGDYDAEY
ncbi:MAG: hypothetical protein EZS28_017431 [Streblomastix strix]|uniref:Uncharacterized protein n=1 Tax=Streblomastix strix TaxID=222440 RepID=A0A5J4VWT5_9EUKA|nr:MAG: hypothetical protein EZS28_017431 [Streblomastix strix]